ncbi:unnamed protein product [Cyprideis torosa]|uniref:Uncharacterized protein n=1 Tax=Cyprideis torosa TaxID=163714 RepID=A0A7R8WKL6_9CRUS|nr:unnamed protein product [Cyprideis torosa]CAG0897240.1 unnamed protein product [Cyprideis torosa]
MNISFSSDDVKMLLVILLVFLSVSVHGIYWTGDVTSGDPRVCRLDGTVFPDTYCELERLEIRNNKITEVTKDAFEAMKRLKNLSISFEPDLTFLDEDVFEHTRQLQQLNLIKNGFRNLSSFVAAASGNRLPELYHFMIGGNDLRRIEEDDFQPLNTSTLQELQVRTSHLGYVHPEAFKHFINLTRLSLRENVIPVENIVKVIENLPETVTALDLSMMGYTSQDIPLIMNVAADKPLAEMLFYLNSLPHISKNTFPKRMDSLKKLMIRKV